MRKDLNKDRQPCMHEAMPQTTQIEQAKMKETYKGNKNAHPFERSNWSLLVFSLAFGHNLEAKDRGEGTEVKHAAGNHSGTPEKPEEESSQKVSSNALSAPGNRDGSCRSCRMRLISFDTAILMSAESARLHSICI